MIKQWPPLIQPQQLQLIHTAAECRFCKFRYSTWPFHSSSNLSSTPSYLFILLDQLIWLLCSRWQLHQLHPFSTLSTHTGHLVRPGDPCKKYVKGTIVPVFLCCNVWVKGRTWWVCCSEETFPILLVYRNPVVLYCCIKSMGAERFKDPFTPGGFQSAETGITEDSWENIGSLILSPHTRWKTVYTTVYIHYTVLEKQLIICNIKTVKLYSWKNSSTHIVCGKSIIWGDRPIPSQFYDSIQYCMYCTKFCPIAY